MWSLEKDQGNVILCSVALVLFLALGASTFWGVSGFGNLFFFGCNKLIHAERTHVKRMYAEWLAAQLQGTNPESNTLFRKIKFWVSFQVFYSLIFKIGLPLFCNTKLQVSMMSPYIKTGPFPATIIQSLITILPTWTPLLWKSSFCCQSLWAYSCYALFVCLHHFLLR